MRGMKNQNIDCKLNNDDSNANHNTENNYYLIIIITKVKTAVKRSTSTIKPALQKKSRFLSMRVSRKMFILGFLSSVPGVKQHKQTHTLCVDVYQSAV